MKTSVRPYSKNANALVKQYESVSFESVHGPVLNLLPKAGFALDVGAGSGRDAAALAQRGFSVVAVEPSLPMRQLAQRIHPDPAIEWIDDALPELSMIVQRSIRFDLIMLSAIWMHLVCEERAQASKVVKLLAKAGGIIYFSLRHGPVPSGRAMYDVHPSEITNWAISGDFRVMFCEARKDPLGRQAVSWSLIVLKRLNGSIA